MKYFLSAVMAAGWFCLGMAAFAQSTSTPSATPGQGIGYFTAVQGTIPSSGNFIG